MPFSAGASGSGGGGPPAVGVASPGGVAPGVVAKTEQLSPVEASAKLLQSFRDCSSSTFTEIQQKLNEFGTCKAEATKNPLARSVAEACGKLMVKYSKVQKAIATTLEANATPMCDNDVRKLMSSLHKADAELLSIQEWARTNGVIKKGSKRKQASA